MRKNRDFVFLRPVRWLGIGMMAARAVAMFRLVLTDFYDTTPETMQSNIETALSTVTSGGISGWEVPTTAEATLIYDARMSIGNLSASSYLCYSSGYRAFKPTDATFSAEKNNVRASTFLRPVATITLTKD